MMTARTEPARGRVPEWVAAEMPPGYRTRLLEIERLSADLQAMDRIARVLWEKGEVLQDAVGTIFAELKCDVDAGEAGGPMAVTLDQARRLLVVVSRVDAPLRRTDEELTRAFQAVQVAGAGDRVVLVTNNDAAAPPAERPDPVLPDALAVLERMGTNVMSSVALFTLWRLSHEDQQKARQALDRLHEQDGGLFLIAPAANARRQETAGSRSRAW